MPELLVSLEKIAWIIVRARELAGKVQPFSDDASLAIEQGGGNLEDRSGDRTRAELRGFLSTLNRDEQDHLLALVWIGREVYSPADWQEALQAAAEKDGPVEQYVLGIPHLAEHLESGLERLGISIKPTEDLVSR